MLKRLTITVALCGLVAAVPVAAQKKSPLRMPAAQTKANVLPGGSIAIERIDGLAGEGQLKAGEKITFHLRCINKTGLPVSGFSNGFRIYSPDGATWTDAVTDTTGELSREQMDGGIFFVKFGVDGAKADTVGFGGFRIMSVGIPDGYTGVPFTITIGPIDPAMAGKTICIDQSFFPPGGSWLWSLDNENISHPDWAGPVCFTVAK